MEVEFVQGVRMGNDLAKAAGKKAKDLGVLLSIHAPYFINLCNPAKVGESQKRILDSCERGHHMGAKFVAFHPGYYGSLTKEQAYDYVKKACAEMAEKVRANGWNVLLGLETTGKHSQFGTLEECIKICREVKGCSTVIDFAHLYAKQGGKIDYKYILDSISALKPSHVHCHFSNIEFTMKGERRHLVLDHSPPFEPLAKEILKQHFDMTIICESPALEQDALRMKKIFENNGYKFDQKTGIRSFL
jgi:deoxyribonuclease-4